MFVKKCLAVGLVAAVGTSTALAADFDLDNANETARVFALETLDSGDVTTVGSVDYPNVNGDATDTLADIDIAAVLGVGVSNTQDLFIRYDLDNGLFGADPAFDVTGATDTIAQGGVGQSFVIVQMTATADLPQTTDTDLDVTVIALTDVSQAVGVTMTVYETLTQAASQGSSLVSKSKASYIQAASGLTSNIAVNANEAARTAEVEEDFKKFATGGISDVLANLGSGTVAATTGVASADDGQQVTLADMIVDTTSTVVISGDFSVNTLSLDDDGIACGSNTDIVPNAGGTESTGLNLDDLNAAEFLCYEAGGTDPIPEGEYTVLITLTPAAATRTNPTASVSGTIGAVAHNGTTVHFPYLTTFSDYNQRIILVNRGGSSADYTITFISEDGVTTAAGSAATGSIPAGGTLVLRVSDVVTITGGTRTAGTVTIVAAEARISVATTQVNLSDGGTDTISLQ